ncbi:MAG: WhiB family transcriptional regulator [Pseudonocardiaceae bacterium]|nr:WhiB family transcriptional regulator [Pseudonocardiaceae bacterium]
MRRRERSRRWFEQAACAGMDTEDFFPLGDGPATARAMEAAKQVCGRCPVRFACLTDALARETPGRRYGVFGGLSADEREQLTTDDRQPPGELGEVA